MNAISPVFESIPDAEDVSDPQWAAENWARGKHVLRRWVWVILVILLIHISSLWALYGRIADREHYQFLPLIPVGFGALVLLRLKAIHWPMESSLTVRQILSFLVAVGLFVLASEFDSHWLAAWSCLLMLWTTVWYFAGASGADILRGPMFFLAIGVPLPLNTDQMLIVELQKSAASVAGAALEWFGIWHVINGVSIQSESKVYFVEQACSGVHSLFSSLAVMAAYCIYCRYSVVRATLTLVLSVVWVIFLNGFRVFAVVLADTQFRVDLDSGWKHEVLGIVVYSLIMVLCLSMDQLLRFIVPAEDPSVHDLEIEFHERVRLPYFAWMYQAFDRPLLRNPTSLRVAGVAVALLTIYAGVAAAEDFFPETNEASGTIAAAALDQQIDDIFLRESLPPVLDGWTRSDFQHEVRSPGDSFGVSSRKWTYNGHGMGVVISVDGYYDHWHDLADCYTGSGWVVQEAANITQESGETAPFTRLTLLRESGQYALVEFSAFDAGLDAVQPFETARSVLRALKSRLGVADLLARSQMPDANVVPPVIQVQLFSEADREFLEHEQTAIHSLFTACRARILEQLRDRK